MPARALYRLAALVAFLGLTGCVTDDVVAPQLATSGTFTVDASASWQYVSLADSALVTPSPAAAADVAWDIAFNATNVTLNGGDAGPGGIEAACICQNATATNDEVLAMTPQGELADFEAVTAVPTGLTWHADRLSPAISGWHSGEGASAAADPTKSWLVRLADGVGYAKVRVVGVSGATAAHPGTVTLEFAVQSTAAAPLGEPETLDVDLSTGPKAVDLASGTTTNSATDWDLRLDGFTIRVNGGVSGPGQGGAAVSTAPFESTTTAVTQANAYRTDTYAGVFGVSRYYRYNLAGDHRISPTFDVYLLRRGAVTYKLQVTGYYGPTGTARQISFRWQRLD